MGKLEKDQMEFVKKKVEELGSINATKEFYYKDDRISQYALVYANHLFGKRRIKCTN